MSLYGVMRTSTSGMSAQANRLATVADNIANVNTGGYKRASAEFSSLLLTSCPGSYNSGAVLTEVRHAIAEQGNLQNSTSVTDLAVNGNGFFVVADVDGTPRLTRAGSFVANGDGELVNAAGFRLMGYPVDPVQPIITVNGFTGLETVNLQSLALSATPSTTGSFTANLPAAATIVPPADLPSANAASAAPTGKSSLVTYDNLGTEVLIDVYFSKTAANSWEVAVFDRAAATGAGGFPYSSGPLATTTLTFDPSNGQLAAASASSIAIPVPNGQTLTLDLAEMSQLSAPYTVLSAAVDGNPPSGVDLIEIAKDGTIYATFGNGTRVPVYRLPLAHVISPDNLIALSGNVFATSDDSGDVQIGFPETANLGSILSNTVELSNVDLGTELTTMIDSQRSYTANSKVFQTGSELMDVLINLKR
jgi:flagellar hook protein FlgE